MTSTSFYLLDSDVFIAAKNAYYAFDICPGFWDEILKHHGVGRAFSISRVRNELLLGIKTENLHQWVANVVPASFFLEVDDEPVINVYTEIMMWSQRHNQYFDAAKAKFATGADGWLVAYARIHKAIVVTNETPAPESKKEIKLPDVCSQFGVNAVNTFDLLRRLGITLVSPAP